MQWPDICWAPAQRLPKWQAAARQQMWHSVQRPETAAKAGQPVLHCWLLATGSGCIRQLCKLSSHTDLLLHWLSHGSHGSAEPVLSHDLADVEQHASQLRLGVLPG